MNRHFLSVPALVKPALAFNNSYPKEGPCNKCGKPLLKHSPSELHPGCKRSAK